jgi:hypothetical protein
MEYQHAEAFMLMWYACPCGHKERFWNARDGVTPFGGVFCPSCGSSKYFAQDGFPGMTHVQFERDMRLVNHQPHPGQRIWRDGTKQEAVQILNNRFELFREKGRPVPEDVQESMMQNLHDTNCKHCLGTGMRVANKALWCECWGDNSEFTKGWPIWERIKDQLWRKDGQ